MMLGYYSGTSEFVPGPLSPTTVAGNPQTHVFNYFAPYAEDDWKVTEKLSMNFGLRWDFRAATYEEHNHFFWLDTQNTQGGLCYADPQLSTDGVAPGVGINGGPILRYCGKVPRPGLKNPFAPRFGVNYRINDNTVVRGGYGIFYSSYEGREIDDSADIYPYAIRDNLNPTTQNSLDQYKLSNGLFPSYSTLTPVPRDDAVVHRRHRVGEPARSLRPVVDFVTGARVGKEHNPGTELCWNQRNASAQPARYRPTIRYSRGKPGILPAAGFLRRLLQCRGRNGGCPVQHCQPVAVSEL